MTTPVQTPVAMTHINDGGTPKCQAADVRPEDLVDAALQAACEMCRSMVMVGPPKQPGCELRPRLDYTPEPMPDADDILTAALHRRNATR